MQQWKLFKVCYDYAACEIITNCVFSQMACGSACLPYESAEGHAAIRMDGTVHTPEYILRRKHFHSGEICILNMICQMIMHCSLFTQVLTDIRYRSFLTWNSRVPNRERAQFYRETSIKTRVFCSFSLVRNCSRLSSRTYSRLFTSLLTSSFKSYWYMRRISLRAHSQT